MAFKMKYKSSAFPFKGEDKSEKQKAIDNAIDEGYVPKPNTKKLLKQFGSVYFDEKLV